MAILPDHKIMALGYGLIEPFDPAMIQPASYDIHLDRYFYRARTDHAAHIINPAVPNDDCFDELEEVEEGNVLVLNPRDFVLASTFETVTLPDNLVARFEGKSSLGRLGLLTHITAGFIDPGFSGHITVELKNVTNFNIILHPGMKIGQLCFEEMVSSVLYPYGSEGIGSHYQYQFGPVLSQSHLKFNTINVYGDGEEALPDEVGTSQ